MPSHSAAQLRLALLLLSVLFGSPRAVRAAELSWSAPAECGSAAELSAQVESLIHAPLSAVVDLDFEVRIQPAAHGGFALWLGTRSHTGGAARARELSGAECRDVVEAAAVAIALAITRENPEPAAPAAVSGEPATVAPASTPPPPPPSAAEPAASARLSAAASAVLDAVSAAASRSPMTCAWRWMDRTSIAARCRASRRAPAPKTAATSRRKPKT